MNRISYKILLYLLIVFSPEKIFSQRPNVIIVYADDLGYGDLSCYGATKINTPHIDALAKNGVKFTRAYTSSATCTPSRYALMTGVYPWRKTGTGVLTGDASLIIDTAASTLPKIFKQHNYKTGIVGKWHLGLGSSVEKNWNEKIYPGPNEVGFDYSFIFPATADRVPTVFMENGSVIGLDKNDIIHVNYKEKIGNEPTGKENPELLKLKNSPNHGHDFTIVNGIGRIGYMTGGKMARWVDEEIGTTFLHQSLEFIDQNKKNPFFLFFSLTEPHVPRMPATMFKGKSGLGLRGDAILQIDWTVGQLVAKLKSLDIFDNTIVILTSDNGPVLDDGYMDEAVTALNGHTPSGGLRGGKYSIFEAGTRVPFILHWPAKIKKGKSSDALISQIDLLASTKSFLSRSNENILDSKNIWSTLIGQSNTGRENVVIHAGTLALVTKDWKYIAPSNGPKMSVLTNIELGNSSEIQLYDLKNDIQEKRNLAAINKEKVKELESALEKIKSQLVIK